MIDHQLEELASLYVLGALTETESREFKQALATDPELQELVARLSAVTGALAGIVPAMEPPPQLRAKILARIEGPQKIVSLPQRKSVSLSRLPWAFAACLAVLCLLLFVQDGWLKKTIGEQAQRISDLDQLARSLQSATNELRQTVQALRETNRLASLRIALLNSLLADSPKTVAVTLWDESKQQGVFVVQNLKPLPPDKDYQLWVLDNGTTPVDAGVFRVDEAGNVRVEFKTRLPIKVAGKFAVTKEPKGGAASPTLKDMVLLGS